MDEYCEEDFMSKSLLKKRGWTETCIKKILGDPDFKKDNPCYTNGPKMCLYFKKRVEKKEKTKEFKDFIKKSKNRKAGCKKAIETKKENLINKIKKLDLKINRDDNVVKRAIQSYNSWHKNKEIKRDDYYDFEYATKNSDIEFLNRITVNFIRHKFSSYEDELGTIFNKVGVKEAYIELNKKIYSAILEAYPEFKEECNLQLINKIDGYNY